VVEVKRRGVDLVALRARVRQLERGGGAAPWRALPLGLRELDEALPGGGLPLGGLHEIVPARSEWDDGPAAGFALALLAAVARDAPGFPASDFPLAQDAPGALLWVSRHDDLHAPGCAGLPAERLLRVGARRDEEVYWALEEGLRCPEVVAVLGEVASFERTASRRLQLAAEAAGRPCFLLRRQAVAGGDGAVPSPALTRWRVTAAPSRADLSRGLVGRPCWRVDLLRCRGARPNAFLMEWDDATGALALAASLRDRALRARSLA